jgi:hypothetical protein
VRLWTIHPRYLDPQGLVALWRESLLARAVLRGQTPGYRHHPQLARFYEHPTPRYAINAYLAVIHREATARGFLFDARKLGPVHAVEPIVTTTGQVMFEWQHLQDKLATRNSALRDRWRTVRVPQSHPLFNRIKGPPEYWERGRIGNLPSPRYRHDS